MSEQDRLQRPETDSAPRSETAVAPAPNRMGSALVQRKIQRRILQRQAAEKAPEKEVDGGGAGAGDAKPEAAGAGKPDAASTFDQLTFKDFLGDREKKQKNNWTHLGPTLLKDEYFGGVDAANSYYAKLQKPAFLGTIHKTDRAHPDLIAKLAEAEQL